MRIPATRIEAPDLVPAVEHIGGCSRVLGRAWQVRATSPCCNRIYQTALRRTSPELQMVLVASPRKPIL